jgi:hypothetical protein
MPELPNAPALSVQIPTRGRAERLGRCIAALAQDSRDLGMGEVEVLVGLDGADEAAGRAAREAWHAARPDDAQALRVLEFPREGHLPIRRALVGMTAAPIVVFMNDDVVARAGFLAAHAAAHREAAATGRYPHGVMVVGRTPWAVPGGGVDQACDGMVGGSADRRGGTGTEGSASDCTHIEEPGPKHDCSQSGTVVAQRDSLFDRMVRETSLIFFYDQMEAGRAERWRDWGFRHFWTLNASAPRRAVLAAGGVTAIPETYGHEDIELAFRLGRQFGMPVLYRPEAMGVHEHRYTPADVMRREVSLGAASWRFARVNPEFGMALFGRDVTGEAEVGYSRAFVRREAGTVERLKRDFERLWAMPADAASGEALPVLAGQFVMLKRWLWRTGLLEAADAGRAGGQDDRDGEYAGASGVRSHA